MCFQKYWFEQIERQQKETENNSHKISEEIQGYNNYEKKKYKIDCPYNLLYQWYLVQKYNDQRIWVIEKKI